MTCCLELTGTTQHTRPLSSPHDRGSYVRTGVLLRVAHTMGCDMSEEVVSTGDNPWKIMLSLLRDFPDDWVINQYTVEHTPSGCEIKWSGVVSIFGRVTIESMGTHVAPWYWSRQIRKQIRQVIAERMLATSRQKLLVPEKFDKKESATERSARLRKSIRDSREVRERMHSENPFGVSILEQAGVTRAQKDLTDSMRYLIDGHNARRKSKKES